MIPCLPSSSTVKFFISEFHILSFVFLRLRCVGRLCFLRGFQLVADGFTGSGLLRDGVVDGSSSVFYIGADILDALRKANGAVLVLDVGQPDFISGKINRVDSAPDAVHIQRRADRNELISILVEE